MPNCPAVSSGASIVDLLTHGQGGQLFLNTSMSLYMSSSLWRLIQLFKNQKTERRIVIDRDRVSQYDPLPMWQRRIERR